MQPANSVTRAIRDESVVVYGDGYLRVWCGDIPLGPRIQTPGKRCPPWSHDWQLEEYERINGTYVDRVCRKCCRRKPMRG